MVKRRSLWLAVGLIWIMSALLTEADITTSLKTSNTSLIYHQADNTVSLINYSLATLDFKSQGAAKIKGELEVNALVADRIILDIPRVYVKARLPWFDLTAGKTRLSWGEGFAFNAGDVLFDSMSPSLNLASGVLRAQTAHLAALTAYFGSFTFLELVALPGSHTMEFIPQSGIFVPAASAFTEISAGGRFMTKLGIFSGELGYLYKGTARTHNPYISLHSAFLNLFDYYWNASCSLDSNGAGFNQNLKTACGLSQMISCGNNITLNIRAEAAIYPYALWTEQATPPAAVTYGLYLYPEISLTLPEHLGLQLRALISPIDQSGLCMGGINWSPFQGFNLSLLLSVMFGDSNDLYGQSRDNDTGLILNIEYLFGG